MDPAEPLPDDAFILDFLRDHTCIVTQINNALLQEQANLTFEKMYGQLGIQKL
jgi:hypothetical protein